MATKKKKSSSKSKAKRPAKRKAVKAAPATRPAPAPAPSQAAQSHLSYWPLAVLVLIAGGIFFGLRAHQPAVTVTDNLPPARTVAPNAAPSPVAAPAATAAPAQRAGAAKAYLAGSAARVWDRSADPKVTFQVMRSEGQAAEVPIFNSKSKLVRKLSSEVGKTGVVKLVWDGKDKHGHPVPAGTYFARINAQNTEVIQELDVR